MLDTPIQGQSLTCKVQSQLLSGALKPGVQSPRLKAPRSGQEPSMGQTHAIAIEALCLACLGHDPTSQVLHMISQPGSARLLDTVCGSCPSSCACRFQNEQTSQVHLMAGSLRKTPSPQTKA